VKQCWHENESTETGYNMFGSGSALVAFMKSKSSERIILSGVCIHVLTKQLFCLRIPEITESGIFHKLRLAESPKCKDREFNRAVHYRLVDKYMRQPPALDSGVRISRKLISRVWTFRKIK
jgi:hypothetical protein